MNRLTFVLPSLAIGGTERQVLYLMEGLADGYALNVICTRERGALARRAERYANVVSLGCRSGWDWRLRTRVARALERRPADILHSFMFGFDYPVNLAARAQGVPVVLSSRRQLAAWKKPRHIRLQRRANRLVDCMVANSRAAAEFAAAQEGEPVDRFHVIPNAVEPAALRDGAARVRLRANYGLPPAKRVVGIVANFSPVKDHGLFLDTARLLARRRRDLHFLLIGSGPLRQSIEDRVRAAGLDGDVTILSGETDPSTIYSLIDVSVLCSHMEGSPNAVIEAMAARVPVVAPAVGGVPELIAHEETGLLLQSRNPEDFARAIERVLNDENGETARMVEAAAGRVSAHHSMDALAAAYRSLYEELLGRTARIQGAA